MAETAYMGALECVPDRDRDTLSHREIQQALAEFFMDLGLYASAKYGIIYVIHMLNIASAKCGIIYVTRHYCMFSYKIK